MMYTTIQELYEWAVKNDALNLPLGIEYQDEGGSYNTTSIEHPYTLSDSDVETVELYISKVNNDKLGECVILS